MSSLFIKNKNDNNKWLKFGLLNAGSLDTNQDEFLIAMNKHSVVVMAINETRLRLGEEGRAPKVPGYRLQHLPRPESVRGGRGGGVAFYIKSGLNTKIRKHPIQTYVEQLWLSLSINGRNILIGTVYRPPWVGVRQIFGGYKLKCHFSSSLWWYYYFIKLLDRFSNNSKKY